MLAVQNCLNVIMHDYNLPDQDSHLLAFYKQVILYWQDIATATPKNKSEVLSQPIWNNRFLTVNKKMVFFPHWYQAGIKQILDLFDSCEGHFLPFNSFCNKFNVKCNFLQYYRILSSIPQNWKKVCQKVLKTQWVSECQTPWDLFINWMHASSFKNRFRSGTQSLSIRNCCCQN